MMDQTESTISNKPEQTDYKVTEEDFSKAIRAAGLLALKRLWRKMSKVKYRAAEWQGVVNRVESPLNPGTFIFVLDKSKPHGVINHRLMPADLDKYVTNFVLMYKDKEPVRK